MILTQEQEMIRDSMRAFAQERLAPFAAEWDKNHTFPAEALKELGELGAMGMCVPEEWDGAGMDYMSLVLTLEEIAAGDGATSTIVSVQNSLACGITQKYGTDAQKEEWLKPLARGETGKAPPPVPRSPCAGHREPRGCGEPHPDRRRSRSGRRSR